MNDEAINRLWFHQILGGVFVVSMLAHFVLSNTTSPPAAPSIAFLLYLWGPVTTGITAVGVFYVVFQRWLWRLRLLHPWLVKFPDLTGTWNAEFEGVTFKTYFRSVVTIEQRLASVKFTSCRLDSRSESVACMLSTAEGNRTRLYVVYENKVLPLADVDFHRAEHMGCFQVDLSEEEWTKDGITLSGRYWTDKLRSPSNAEDLGTWGRVSMRWQHRELSNPNDPPCRKFLESEGDRTQGGPGPEAGSFPS